MLSLPSSKINEEFIRIFRNIPTIDYKVEKADVAFVQTPDNDLELIVHVLEIEKDDIFYELGSGAGKVSCYVSLRTGARCYGFEIRPTLLEYSRVAAKELGVSDRVEFYNVDFLRYKKYDMRDATAIYFYLNSIVCRSIFKVLSEKADPYTKVLSRAFLIPELNGKKFEFNDREFYLYEL